MDTATLPFDADDMLAGLRPWVECESPTFDAPAVNRMMDLVTRDLVLMGARVDRVPGRMGFGDCLWAALGGERLTTCWRDTASRSDGAASPPDQP